MERWSRATCRPRPGLRARAADGASPAVDPLDPAELGPGDHALRRPRPVGNGLLSTAFAALLLAVFSRPKIDRRIRQGAVLILLFGLADAATALCFFRALQYIPLGIAAAISF